MLKRLGMVFLFACFLALGVALSRASPPALDANGNAAPPVAGTWPDNLNRDPGGEWSAFFDVYMPGGAIAHIRWPNHAFLSHADCIRVVSTDRIFALDFRSVMRVVKESLGDSTPVGIHCAPYGESK